MSVRFCMIGCGAFARQFHGPAQQRCAHEDPTLEPAACCDVAIARAEAYASAFGFARAYGDWREMLAAEKPTAVILAVPPEATAATGSAVLELGFPLLLEKPPGVTVAELSRLQAAAKRGAAPAQVAFNRRHMPVVRRAREIIADRRRENPPTWLEFEMARHARWDPDFSTTAVHAIDGARVLAGSPFLGGTLRTSAQADGRRRAIDATLDLVCASGLAVRISIRPVAGVNRERAVMHGRGWTLEVTVPFPSGPFAAGHCELWSGGEPDAAFDDQALPLFERMGVLDETRAFLAAIETRGVPTPALEECGQQVELMELLRRGVPGDFALVSR